MSDLPSSGRGRGYLPIISEAPEWFWQLEAQMMLLTVVCIDKRLHSAPETHLRHQGSQIQTWQTVLPRIYSEGCLLSLKGMRSEVDRHNSWYPTWGGITVWNVSHGGDWYNYLINIKKGLPLASKLKSTEEHHYTHTYDGKKSEWGTTGVEWP